MNLQEIDEVMQTSFWKDYVRRIVEKRENVSRSYQRDSILEERAWLKHIKYQGELEGMDWILRLPEEMIKDAKGRLGE